MRTRTRSLARAMIPSGERIASCGCGTTRRMASLRTPRTYQTVLRRCSETVATGPRVGLASPGMRSRTSTWPLRAPVQRNGPATGSAMPTSRRMKETAVATASAVVGGLGLVTGGWVGGEGAGVVVAGAATVGGAAEGLDGVVGWPPQPASARLAASRVVASARMGRMVLIPLWAPDAGGACCDGHRSHRSQTRSTVLWLAAVAGWRLPAPQSPGGYGMYCWAILVTWSWRTVTQNTAPSVRKVASLARVTGTFLVALPVHAEARVLTVTGASARTGRVRSLGLTLRM